MMEIDFVRSRFIKHFDGKTGNVYASPGRINLIGEHTDYNGGFVFPGAVDKCIMAEMRANGTEDTVMAYAIDLKDRVDFHLNDPAGPRASWARYIYGIALEMRKLGVPVKGFNIAFAGDVPLGAGMSSSAAMESCFACGLNDIFGDNKVSQWDMALAGQATEHNYCGVNCGIMDQFASVFGKAGCLMRLDCRSREFEYFPFKPDGYRLVLLDSVVKHQLAGSPYNDRRNSCENVVKHIQAKHPEGKFETLRDCTWEQLDEVRAEVGEEDYKRAKFVLGEKDRVSAASPAHESWVVALVVAPSTSCATTSTVSSSLRLRRSSTLNMVMSPRFTTSSSATVPASSVKSLSIQSLPALNLEFSAGKLFVYCR